MYDSITILHQHPAIFLIYERKHYLVISTDLVACYFVEHIPMVASGT